jgi:predicted lysophospholipase L1 biosynthesis ABC-type transport system permease subunit
MARKFFGSDSPLGRTFRVPLGPNVGDPITIVGVVEDAKYARLTEKNQPTAYVPFGQGDGGSGVTFIMRGAGSPGALIPEVKQLFAQADPGLMLDITTFTAQVSASLARPRLLATLAGFFGTLALLLAIIGLYGTVSYDVNRRRGEIGIRMALGAGAPGVVRLVLGDAGRLVALGVLVGITLVIVSTRFVASLLYGLAPRDPLTLTVATVTLVVVAMVAALAPALRASRLAPMDALRED